MATEVNTQVSATDDNNTLEDGKPLSVKEQDVPADEMPASESRRLLRLIDFRIMPMLFVAYMFQYLDKAALSNTAIMGLRTDLQLTGEDYSWASSVFNFGYLVASGPIALLMVRFPIGKFMAASVLIWACVLMCMAATHNAAGLIATRFFLGFSEAAVAPGFSVITSIWYTRSEQPIRHGIWFLGNVCSGFFGGPLMFAFVHVSSIAPWKLVFIVFGAVTALYGLILAFILPDSPSNAWFLSDTDKIKAVNRVRSDAGGVKHNRWKKDQMIEAFCDPKAWFSVVIMLCNNIPNGGIMNFAAIVIQGFGFSTEKTFLVNMIVTAFQGFFVLVATLGSTYFKNTRTLWSMVCGMIAIIGAIVIRQLDNSNLWARYSGYCLLSAYTANFPLVLALNTANFMGITKKTTVNAMSFTAYCVGNIIGPHLFFASESPSYPSGFAAMLVCFGVQIIVVGCLRLYLIRENKKRDRLHGSVMSADDDVSALHLEDLTDTEMVAFRYVY